jgi:hypothetical protein
MPFLFDPDAFDADSFDCGVETVTAVGMPGAVSQIIPGFFPREIRKVAPQPAPKRIPAIRGRVRTEQQQFQFSFAAATQEFRGEAASSQQQQTEASATQAFLGEVLSASPVAHATSAQGEVIDQELEMMLAIIQAA